MAVVGGGEGRAELARLREEFLARFDVVGSATTVARELGVNRHTAAGWVRQAGKRSHGPGGRGRHPGRDEFERLRGEGVRRAEAARVVGVNIRTARDWDHGVHKTGNSRVHPDGRRVDYTTGMITMVLSMAKVEKVLDRRFVSLAERETITDLRREGLSIRRIANRLGRHPSTISREVARNSDKQGEYRPHAAHRAAAVRRTRPKPSKLAFDSPLRDYVTAKLAVRWSPEQICHALVAEFPHDPEMRVSHETIYQALYLQARGGLRREVAAALRTGRARRRPCRDTRTRQSRFLDPMVMISERPAEVADRAMPGHWEGDLIIGAEGGSAIGTLVERATRYVMLVHLPDGRSAEQVRDGLVATMATLPAQLRGSLTWDQGSEMAAHVSFSLATDMPVYFCDPASPWQRGSNENTNGLLRQYFPKGTDLSVHDPADLEHVAQQLNGRPRKTLGWKTPAERLRQLLSA